MDNDTMVFKWDFRNSILVSVGASLGLLLLIIIISLCLTLLLKDTKRRPSKKLRTSRRDAGPTEEDGLLQPEIEVSSADGASPHHVMQVRDKTADIRTDTHRKCSYLWKLQQQQDLYLQHIQNILRKQENSDGNCELYLVVDSFLE